MKKLILKWLGLENVLTFSHSDFIDDCVTSLLARRYDLDGLVSNFEDLKHLVEDKEYRWDDMADKVEYFDADDYLMKDELKDKLSDFQEAIEQVQELDDRLTQLVAGYRLDVQLIKEEF